VLVTSNALCMSVMVYVSGCCLILMSHDQMQRTKANESQVCLLVCNIHLQLSIGLSLCSQDSPRLHGLGLNFLVSNIIVQAAYLGFRWIIPRKMKTRLTFRFWHVIGAELEQCCLPLDFRRQILQCVCLGYSACSLVGFSQGLSVMVQCFSLTTNQHQLGLSAQKPTSEHAD